MRKSFLFFARSISTTIKRFSYFLFILPFSLVYSQTTDEILVGAIRENSYHLMVDDGVLTGTGAPVILESIPGSQFLLVGEQHGIVEPAIFTEALFREAMQHQYRYLCIETDPFVANGVENVIRQSPEAVTEFMAKYPMGVPFYNTREDLRLLHTAIGLSPATHPVLWGVDQVFMGAPRFLFYRLAELAPDYQKEIITKRETIKASAGDLEKLKTSIGIEGIWWAPDSTYQIAIIKHPNQLREYAGIIVHSANPNWSDGQVKIELAHTPNGQLDGVMYYANHQPHYVKYTIHENRLGGGWVCHVCI